MFPDVAYTANALRRQEEEEEAEKRALLMQQLKVCGLVGGLATWVGA